MFVDPRTATLNRAIFNAIVAPRPIGWISSQGPDGHVNLAPFSHFNIVSTAPPVLIFSCNTPPDRAEKDTLANVRATKEFVFNLATYALRQAMNTTSTPAPYEVDEFELAALEKAPSVNVAPPRVAASPANLECKLLRIVEIEPEVPGDTAATLCSAAWSACTSVTNTCCPTDVSTPPRRSRSRVSAAASMRRRATFSSCRRRSGVPASNQTEESNVRWRRPQARGRSRHARRFQWRHVIVKDQSPRPELSDRMGRGEGRGGADRIRQR
jgi:flavin reductase (DIM6/NTAB) family NADH-FMN oxidoreductase RutF